MAKTDPINIANPPGGSAPALGDDYIRTLARAVIELLSKDHYVGTATDNAYDEDAAGEHSKVTLRQITKPSSVADKGFLYTKDLSGTTELFYEDEAGNEVQLTSGGYLGGPNNIKIANPTPFFVFEETDQASPAGRYRIYLAGDLLYIQGLNTAGSAYNSILAFTREGDVVLGNTTAGAAKRKITNLADPASAQDAATKKYVDDLKIVPAKVTNVFGSWATKTVGTQYTAETDGFVMAWINGNGAVYCETPVGTKRTQDCGYSNAGSEKAGSIMCPVRKGDTWKVDRTTTDTTYVYWLPIGT